MKIVNKFLPANSYTAVNTNKKRICLHHTVSSPLSIDGDLATFAAQRNIATQYIIGGDGTIYKCIPENYWAHHLGLRTANNVQLNQETIGIEIDAWGQLSQATPDVYLTAYGRPIPSNLPVETLEKPFRGSRFYQEYSDAQISSLRQLLLKLFVEHLIPVSGLCKTLNFELLKPDEYVKPGLYSHSNFRADKSDVYPAKKLIYMLRML